MVNKLEVGMYVRTDKGVVGKIIKKDVAMLTYENSNRNYITYDTFNPEIKKASYNIIDLIGVGDYVNGKKVVFIDENNDIAVDENDVKTRDWEGRYEFLTIKKENIKSIVTKEQFESMEYRIGE